MKVRNETKADNSYQMFVDGKFNGNIPGSFNFATMRHEGMKKAKTVYEPSIEILK